MHQRIEADLRRSIADGAWGVGAQLPSEDALRRHYGVSRMTVRHALERLTSAGLLVKRQGVGTFVAANKIERVSSRILGFHEDAEAHGLRPETKVLEVARRPAGITDGLVLGLAEDTMVLEVRRLRFADAEPIGVNTVLVVPPFDETLHDLDFSTSLYAGAAERLGVEVAEVQQTVEATLGGPEVSGLLGVEPATPMLCVTRVTYLADGRLLGATRSLYRGDRYYLSLALRRTEPVMDG